MSLEYRVAWGVFAQTGTFDAHAQFEMRFCHLSSANTNRLWLVNTFHQLQTSLQHHCQSDFTDKQ